MYVGGLLDADGVDSGRLRDRGVVEASVVGLVVGQAVDEHLELDHPQRGVVEGDDLDRQLVHRDGQQLAQQHASPPSPDMEIT